jgi:hypothetical protein
VALNPLHRLSQHGAAAAALAAAALDMGGADGRRGSFAKVCGAGADDGSDLELPAADVGSGGSRGGAQCAAARHSPASVSSSTGSVPDALGTAAGQGAPRTTQQQRHSQHPQQPQGSRSGPQRHSMGAAVIGTVSPTGSTPTPTPPSAAAGPTPSGCSSGPASPVALLAAVRLGLSGGGGGGGGGGSSRSAGSVAGGSDSRSGLDSRQVRSLRVSRIIATSPASMPDWAAPASSRNSSPAGSHISSRSNSASRLSHGPPTPSNTS